MPIENPSVREYLLKRKAEREALEKQNQEDDSGPNISAALAAIGAGFQGKDSMAASQSVLDRQSKERQDKVSNFDKGTDSFLRDTEAVNAADKMDREKSLQALEDDINSPNSKMANQLAQRMGYQGAPITATQFKSFSPVMKELYQIEQDKARRQEAAEERKNKTSELKVSQAKQKGLYEIGSKAEGQYAAAVKDKTKYDPTAVGQIIDNSNWAPNWMRNDKSIEARAAQDSWIESFLRDASGAAIPDSERASYRTIYFPQPGDTQDVVDNKAALRAQKMDSARVASGDYGPAPKKILKTQTNKRTGEKRIVYTDGSIKIEPGNIAGQ